MNWLLRRVLALGVQFRVRPENAAALLQGCSHPVCYVLERRSVTDLAVLQEACLALKLPRPGRRLGGALKDQRSYFYLTQPRRLWSTRPAARPPTQLAQMIRVLRADPAADFALVPVAVYWGRAPQREASWLRLLLVEDWVLTTRLHEVPAGARQRPRHAGGAGRAALAAQPARRGPAGRAARPARDARACGHCTRAGAPRASVLTSRTGAPS